MSDRTGCPAVELLAVAYHEAGHAVGAVLVSPPLPIDFVTIVPDEECIGRVTYEDWDDLVVPDAYDEDVGITLPEHARAFERSFLTTSYLGARADGWIRTGVVEAASRHGWEGDRDGIVSHTLLLVHEEDLSKAGRGWGRITSARDGSAMRLIERHPFFWRAVGLVAGALIREKTLSGAEVEALVRAARGRS
jgi:hypothetical protein